jgi:dipeptidyl aminopeptidase/acylaminoacyl peptidase
MVRRLFMTLIAALLAAACSAPVAGATTPGDNGRIVYSAETSNGVQLFTVRPDGSNVRQITTVQGDAVHADWAPNGRKLVFEFAGEPTPASH